eukprot:TRINITY_DN6211_c0_g1_i2.p1 TRINITY_DN6211_c0_g1~~TRINITY_DN6211_c0_g1_i2.p1  ORF type:complete len:505 (-),score=93.35 TRINITY_DN6211_c0_g1_i2:131-1645(-)
MASDPVDISFADMDHVPGSISETPLLGSSEFNEQEDIGELEESRIIEPELADGDDEEAQVGDGGPDSPSAAALVPDAVGEMVAAPAGSRKYAHEEPHMESWKRHKKHFFVLTSAGKPVYSRYGDESLLAGFMGVLQAIISFIDDDDDTMRGIISGGHQVAFLIRGPLYFVVVARTSEPTQQLMLQLSYFHHQILSVLTASVNKILGRRAQFDIRNLLGGTEKFLDSLASWMDHDPSFILSSIHCLRLPAPVRSAIGSIMYSARVPDLLFSILIAKHQLVNLVRPKKHILHPSDLHIIFNFVNACTAFRTSETWTPLCLPKFNDAGFLHTYLNFIAPDVCLVLISTKADQFYQLSQVKNAVVQRFEQAGVFQELSTALENQFYHIHQIGIRGLVHFVYKSIRTSQITCPLLEAPYVDRHERKRLFRLYQRIHRRVLPKGSKPHSVYYLVSETETVIIWTSSGFILYATFGPLTSLKDVITGCNNLIRWIKQEETTIFVIDSPMFN